MSQKKQTEDDAAREAVKPHWQAVEEALEARQSTGRRARRALRRLRYQEKKSRQSPAAAQPVVFVTDTLARRSVELLTRPQGQAAGVVYWFGFECGERAAVSTVIVPQEEGRADAVLASAVANEEVFSAIVGASLVFLGQLRLAAVGAEERKAPDPGRDVRFEGSFYIEVPPGTEAASKRDPAAWRIFRQIQGETQTVQPRDLDRHLRIIPGFKDLRGPRARPPRIVTTPLASAMAF